MTASLPQLEICFSPALLPSYQISGKIVVLVDILRATSSICAAFHNGVASVIPVGSVEEARVWKNNGFLLAGETDGVKLSFADFGNSPFNFMTEAVRGREIVYCTTNGTKAVKNVAGADMLLIGSYLNITALCDYLQLHKDKDVFILCAGWKNRFSLEDSLFAGALAERLLRTENYQSQCDSVTAAVDLWKVAEKDLPAYIEKCAHRHRLKNLNLDDVIEYCHTTDMAPCVPVLSDNKFVNINTLP